MQTSTQARLISGPNRVLKTLMMGAMVLASYGASMPAAADRARQISVRYDDLNLSSASGIEVLKRRIRGAAEIVCGEADTRELSGSMLRRQCVREAADAALKQVNWQGR